MEWISFKEKEPQGKRFLVTDGNQVCLHFINREENVSGEIIESIECHETNDECSIFERTITHWMPLPEPPKGKE